MRRHADVAILALMVIPSPACAAEDGGTRSHFARGAGGRATGMGGAFVALADDASASIWNPGGLALVSRLTYELNHTRLEAAEANEEFAAIALPSWRWGTLAFSLRHLAVAASTSARAQCPDPLDLP